jgi:Family of unknown function (DUF695)
VPLFKRSRSDDALLTRIEAFWIWWGGVRQAIEVALRAKQLPPRLIDEMTERTKAIDVGLAWELGPGLRAPFQLCVSAEGDLERRAMTEMWRRAAPSDPNWDYFPARQPESAGSSYTLTLGPHKLDPAELRFSSRVDVSRERINLSVWHPIYPSLDEGTRRQATYLLLDGLLGEDAVERWCGTIETSVETPTNEWVDRSGLQHQLEALAASATRERYVLGQSTAPNGQVRIVAMNTALKHIDHLDKPDRLRLVIHLTTAGPTGLPDRAESESLEAFEDRASRSPPGAVFAGRVTGSGTRTLNWYVSDASQAKAALDAVRRDGAWRTEVSLEADARWKGLSNNLID